jgi:hypothetical protein
VRRLFNLHDKEKGPASQAERESPAKKKIETRH